MPLLRNIVLVLVVVQSQVAFSQTKISSYAEDVLTHIIVHEVGHALIREFDIPLMGNEEVIADDFATTYIARAMPNRALQIVTARANSLNLEADGETVFSEHPSDKRRAGRIVCMFHGLSPHESQELAKSLGMTKRESAACRDSAPEIARGWRRILKGYQMPSDARVTEVRVLHGEGPWKEAILESGILRTIKTVLTKFDWHSLITLHFDHCEGGANWSRRQKQILVCDDLIERLERQAGQQN